MERPGQSVEQRLRKAMTTATVMANQHETLGPRGTYRFLKIRHTPIDGNILLELYTESKSIPQMKEAENIHHILVSQVLDKALAHQGFNALVFNKAKMSDLMARTTTQKWEVYLEDASRTKE